MIVDTSAVLAVFFGEPEASKVAEQFEKNKTKLRMSTVNLTETLILLRDRYPSDFPKVEEKLLKSPIRFEPPTTRQAQIAAAARLRFPLNLGACFAYALAVDSRLPLLTLDRDFLHTDITVVLPA